MCVTDVSVPSRSPPKAASKKPHDVGFWAPNVGGSVLLEIKPTPRFPVKQEFPLLDYDSAKHGFLVGGANPF